MSAPPGAARFTVESIAAALARIEGAEIVIHSVASLAQDRAATEPKHAGYGDSLLVRYLRVSGGGSDGEERRAVLRIMAPDWFGHDRRADRAALVLLAADTYDTVPRHPRVLDVGALGPHGELLTLAGAGELYLITTFAEGDLYAHDLRRIEASERATRADVDRARALASYLMDLHRQKVPGPPERYHRAIRDLVGSGEGLFGIADSYPDGGPIPRARLLGIEHRAVVWYPALTVEQRRALLGFAERVLDARAFDPRDTSGFAPS